MGEINRFVDAGKRIPSIAFDRRVSMPSLQSILKGHGEVIDKLCSIILVMTNIAMAVQEQVDIKVKALELMQNLLAVQKFVLISEMIPRIYIWCGCD